MAVSSLRALYRVTFAVLAAGVGAFALLQSLVILCRSNTRLGGVTCTWPASVTRRWLAGRVLLKIVYVLACRLPRLAAMVFRSDQDAELLVLRLRTQCWRQQIGRVRYEPAG